MSSDGPAGTGPAGGGSAGEPEALVVTRSGGLAGRRESGEVRLGLGEDPRAAEVVALLARIDFRTVPASRPQPDRYVYAFRVLGHRAEEVVVQEQDLTPDLDRLARLVLHPA